MRPLRKAETGKYARVAAGPDSFYVMLTEPKYCEMCAQQFFRAADAPIPERAKYCDACERAITHAAHEQATNDRLIGRRYDGWVN